MRCSYCGQKGHSKRHCPLIQSHFDIFLTTSKAIRRDFLNLLSEKQIGLGTHFKVVDYGNTLVRVVGIRPVHLFSTWAGGRTYSSWGFLPLDKMKKIVVEQCPDGLEGAGVPWVRTFSVQEILERHAELHLVQEPILDESEKSDWLACAEYKKTSDMVAVKGKSKASVFKAKAHPYIQP